MPLLEAFGLVDALGGHGRYDNEDHLVAWDGGVSDDFRLFTHPSGPKYGNSEIIKLTAAGEQLVFVGDYGYKDDYDENWRTFGYVAFIMDADENVFVLNSEMARDGRYSGIPNEVMAVGFVPPSDVFLVTEGQSGDGHRIERARVCPRGMTDHDFDQSTRCEDCGAGVYMTAAGSRGACSMFTCAEGTFDSDANPSTPCDACSTCGADVGGVVVTECSATTDSVCAMGEPVAFWVPEETSPTVHAFTPTIADFAVIHAGEPGVTNCVDGGVYTNGADGTLNAEWHTEFVVDNGNGDVDIEVVACNNVDGSWQSSSKLFTVARPSSSGATGVTTTVTVPLDLANFTPERRLAFRQAVADALGDAVDAEDVFLTDVQGGTARRVLQDGPAAVDVTILVTLGDDVTDSQAAAIVATLGDADAFPAALKTGLVDAGLVSEDAEVTLVTQNVGFSGQATSRFSLGEDDGGAGGSGAFVVGIIIVVLIAAGVWKATEGGSIKATAQTTESA